MQMVVHMLTETEDLQLLNLNTVKPLYKYRTRDQQSMVLIHTFSIIESISLGTCAMRYL